MLLSEIFKIGIRRADGARDIKFKKCEHISLIEEAPFVKRCTNAKVSGLKVCLDHAITVSFHPHSETNEGEKTSCFSSVAEAEKFRKEVVYDCWTETNYSLL